MHQHENNHESYHVLYNLDDHADQVVKAVPYTQVKEELSPEQNDTDRLKGNQPGVRRDQSVMLLIIVIRHDQADDYGD